MKRFLIAAIMCCAIISSHAQDPVYDSLKSVAFMSEGVGDYHTAISVYEQMAGLYPKNSEPVYYIADAYYQISDYDNALSYCAKTIKKKGDYVSDAYNLQGMCYNETGQNAKALKAYEKCLELDPLCSAALYNMGNIYYEQDVYKKAEYYYIAAIEIDPWDCDYHYNLALTEYFLDEHVKSILCFYFYLILDSEDSSSADAFGFINEMIELGYPEEGDEEDTFYHFSDDPALADVETFLSNYKYLIENDAEYAEALELPDTVETAKLFTMFNMLKASRDEGPRSGNLWWDFYIPFYSGMVEEGLLDPFYFHISYAVNERSEQWLDNNEKLYDKFIEYVYKDGEE